MPVVVLDANVVISGIIAPLGYPARILTAWKAQAFDVVMCPALFTEIEEKLVLPRISNKYHLDAAEVAAFLLRLEQTAHWVSAIATVDPVPPDIDDTMLFAAAIESQADYMVTGDKLLLAFIWPGPAEVLSPREFWLKHLSGLSSP